MNKNEHHATLWQLLDVLETELKQAGLWASIPPSPEALSSVMPFMYDTLRPFEWLQWIFIPRTRALMDSKGQLPGNCNIHPLMEHYLASRDDIQSGSLLTAILAIDNHMNNASS